MNERRNEPVRENGCCEEFAAFTRRRLVAQAGKLAAMAAAPALLPRLAFSRGGGADRDVMLVVFLRGGMDGMTTCVPYGDGDLYVQRPELAVPPPGPNGALDLDGFFGLAPAAAPLLTPWGNSHLAIVHAAGSTDPTRSHFDAMRRMEFGIPELPDGTESSGWLARHLQTVDPSGSGLLRGLMMEDFMSQTLAQAPAALPIDDLDAFTFPGSSSTVTERRHVMQSMYQAAGGFLGQMAGNTLATVDVLEGVDFAGYAPDNGASYPAGEFGSKLRNLSALIKADVGLECAEVDLGGWDLHNQLGPLDGSMAALLDQLCRGLEAFYLDNLDGIDRLVVVAMSEFGRRAHENASAGVDHGHGNALLVIGGHIAGGKVFGQWPGLAPGQLDNGDLAITTDYRDVLGEILALRMDNESLDQVFPSHTMSFLGVTN